ncbi:hypothetical protein O3W44_02645 [Pantoea sp. LMR881]|uniref:hypothetical protein n=1 Tax=Pantoea sp. LMR881 TaxID=3014336 RepID=UPI0022AECCEF|nr:hypothetical protein [Pantoea sp. LMR881]MCZ4058231.1 hypothetical protein [Pantoea sp. LMR881]
MAWYTTGTIAVSGTTVTGTGTNWLDNKQSIGAGQALLIPGSGTVKMYEIASVTSATKLTLKTSPGTIAAGQAYAILSFYTDSVPDFARRLAAQLSYYQSQMDGWQQIMTGTGNVTLTAPDGMSVTISSFSKLTSDMANKLDVTTGGEITGQLKASGTISREGSGTLSFNANRTNSDANSYYGAQTTAGQIFFGTGSGANFVVNNSQSNSGAWLSVDANLASFANAISCKSFTASSGTMTGAMNMNSQNLTNTNIQSWISTAAAYATLANLGFSSPGTNQWKIPCGTGSRTLHIQTNSAVVTLNSSGETTIAFPSSFANDSMIVIPVLGDSTGGTSVRIINFRTGRPANFDIHVEGQSSSACRINFIAIGY